MGFRVSGVIDLGEMGRLVQAPWVIILPGVSPRQGSKRVQDIFVVPRPLQEITGRGQKVAKFYGLVADDTGNWRFPA